MARSLVQSQFGTNASAYAVSDVHARGWSLERLVALVRPEPHWRALDIATGAGHTAAALAPGVGHVIASDVTEEMLREAVELAKTRGLDNLETTYADAESLPFANASFDLVTCRLAAHHFPDAAKFVAEASRVLKSTGLLGLVDNIAPDDAVLPGFSDAAIQDAEATYNAFEMLRDPSHVRALRLREWTELMERRGLAVVAVEHARKDMDFADYVGRMGCDAATVERLEAMLLDGPAALKAFLDPELQEGRITFRLHEAIFVVRKPV